MTKKDDAGLYADIDKIDVPAGLRKLDQAHVDTIAASVKAKGRLYVAVLLKKGKGDRFILEDGQHRLAAMKQNGEKRIRYELVTDENAGDVANMVRKQYSFSERIKVVAQRKEDSDAVLASALGVSERKVKQYRQLSTLPQEVIDAVDSGFMTESVAQRATMLPKDMRDELVKALKKGNLPWWAETVEEIKDQISETRIPIRYALFDVLESGLKYDRDLFEADGGYFHDAKAFKQHQVRAAEQIAKELTDDVTVAIDKYPQEWYNHSSFHHREGKDKVRAALKPSAALLLKDLDDEIGALEKLVSKSKTPLPEQQERLQTAREERNQIVGRPDAYDREKLKNVRVIAALHRDGEVEFKIIPAKVAKKQSSGGSPSKKADASATPKKPLEAHTRKAWAIARDQRDLLIQEAMLANQTFALRVVLASLLTTGEFGVRLETTTIRTDVEDHGKRAKAIPVPKRNDSFPEVWKRVCAMEAPALVAEIITTVAPFNYHGTDYPAFRSEDKQRLEVVREAILCTEAPPLPYDYFAAHQTAQLLKILTKVKGKKEADLYAGKPKKTVAAAVQAACFEAGWLPDLLETDPVPAKPKAKKAAKTKSPKQMAKAA